LNIYASDAEIKRAYRKLALQFHPDKNKSPEAEEIFKEVNEAYECLGDPVHKALYDQMLQGSEVVIEEVEPEQTKHRDPRYRPRPKDQPRQRKPNHREEILAMMAERLNYATLVSRVALIFSIVLVADFFIPKEKSEVEIVGYNISRTGSRRYDPKYQMELSDGSVVTISKEVSRRVKGKFVTVYRTRLFDVPYKIIDRESNIASIDVSIYGNFIFSPLILLITSVLGSFYKKGVEFRFNLGIVNFFMTFLNLVFLQIHKF